MSRAKWYSPGTVGKNFLEEIKNLRGIPAGVKYLGDSVVNDIRVGASAWGVGKAPVGGFRLDDIVRGSANEIQKNWGPLFQGNYTQFAKNYAKNPLTMSLDLATVATGGAAAAGKGATVLQQTGRGGAIARRVGGLQKADADVLAQIQAGRVVPGVVRGRGVAVGEVFTPKKYYLRDVEGQALASLPLARNPLVRGRQLGREKLLAAGVLGERYQPAARGARLFDKQQNRIARRSRLKLRNAAAGVLARLSNDEREALSYVAEGFDNADNVEKLLAFRASVLAELSAKKVKQMPVSSKFLLPDTSGIETPDPNTAKELFNASLIARDVARIRRLRPLLENPTSRMREALDAIGSVEEHNNATLIGLGRLTRDEVEARRSLPLRMVGAAPRNDQRLVTITHIAPARSRKERRARRRGLTMPVLDEAKLNRGINFSTANYTRDPRVVLDSFDRITGADMIAKRLELAMSVARPYKPSDQARIDSGELKLFKPGSSNAIFLRDIQKFLEDDLKPNITDFSDEQFVIVERAVNEAIRKLEDTDTGLVMDRKVYAELTREIKSSKGLITRLASAATGQWRQLVLNLKGTFYINNFLGNLMLGLVSNPARFVPALAVETVRAGKKSKQIREAVPDIPRAASAAALNKQASRMARFRGLEAIGEPVAKLLAHVTDDNFRRAKFRIEANKLADEHAKFSGISKADAWEQVLNDTQAVDHIAQRMYDDLLDYTKLTESERTYLIPFYPFWAFTRSIAGRTIRLAGDEPWKLQALMIWGAYGIEQNENQVGSLPDHLRGLILLNSDKTMPLSLSSYGMNPFTAPVDTSSQIGQLFGVDSGAAGATNPVASMNPAVKAVVETAFGRDAFYGTPVEQSFRGLGGQLAKSVPQYVLYKNLTLPARSPSIVRTPEQQLSAFMGVPVGQLSMSNVRRNEAIQAFYDRKEVRQALRREYQTEARRRTLREAFGG